MGDSWSPRCAYTGSPNHDLGATGPRSPVSVDPCIDVTRGCGKKQLLRSIHELIVWENKSTFEDMHSMGKYGECEVRYRKLVGVFAASLLCSDLGWNSMVCHATGH